MKVGRRWKVNDGGREDGQDGVEREGLTAAVAPADVGRNAQRRWTPVNEEEMKVAVAAGSMG